MNDSADKTRRKRRRSDDYSSSKDSVSRSPSRSRSRDDRKRSKKSKKKHSKSSVKKSKRKRSKSGKKDSKKKDRRRSRTRSPSSASESNYKQNSSNKMMDPMMMPNYMYLPPNMPTMDARLGRAPMYYPPMRGFPMGQMNERAPMNPSSIPMKQEPGLPDQPTDKIVKDQNFLNSDEKLFESIVNNEIGLRNVFEDTQISEHYAGSTLYRTIKKFVHDPNTVIFETNEKSKEEQNGLKQVEIVKNAMAQFLYENSYNKASLNLGDMQNIREQLYNYRNRHKTEELNHI